MTAASLDILIGRLLSPPTPGEQGEGWTPEAKAGIAGYLQAKKEQMSHGPLTGDPSLVRGLDAWGVASGDLYEAIVAFNRRLD